MYMAMEFDFMKEKSLGTSGQTTRWVSMRHQPGVQVLLMVTILTPLNWLVRMLLQPPMRLVMYQTLWCKTIVKKTERRSLSSRVPARRRPIWPTSFTSSLPELPASMLWQLSRLKFVSLQRAHSMLMWHPLKQVRLQIMWHHLSRQVRWT